MSRSGRWTKSIAPAAEAALVFLYVVEARQSRAPPESREQVPRALRRLLTCAVSASDLRTEVRRRNPATVELGTAPPPERVRDRRPSPFALAIRVREASRGFTSQSRDQRRTRRSARGAALHQPPETGVPRKTGSDPGQSGLGREGPVVRVESVAFSTGALAQITVPD
jgi:hypothetical protein